MSQQDKIQRVLQAETLLQITQSLNDVYALIGQLSNDVLDLYPHIACRTQCNTCCKGNSMPVASASEWAVLHDYLMRYYSEAQRSALIERVRHDYDRYKEIYWAVHDNIQAPADMDKIEAFAQLLPQLADTQCPYLQDEVCSVYMGRPAKCRAHGSFLFYFQEHVQLHACQDEVDKMEDYVAKQGSRKVTMPFWNPFEKKIMDDFNPHGALSTILILWTYSHIDAQGQLQADVNLKPDFEALKERDLSAPSR